MKAVTILLLATIATLLLANDVIAQENNESSLIANSIAQYISATTGDSSSASGQYPDVEDEPQQPDGLLTSFLTGPVINNFVRTVFSAVELKLNFLLTLRRILSYENIRACLLHLRKFLNLVLRLCTLINRFLPEAGLDTSGLSTLISYYPAKIPEKPAKPATDYGVPAKPASEYGVPAKPAGVYGVPVKPAAEYGVPAKSAAEYEVPAQTNQPIAFRVSTEASADFDDDDEDDASNFYAAENAKELAEKWNELKQTSEYGVPANEYGVPQDVYGVPNVQRPYSGGYYYSY